MRFSTWFAPPGRILSVDVFAKSCDIVRTGQPPRLARTKDGARRGNWTKALDCLSSAGADPLQGARMTDQTAEFEKESLRYVRSSLHNENRSCLLDEELFNHDPPHSILDVGCGNGANLHSLCEAFGAKGVGVEPSAAAVELLEKKFLGKNNISFAQASAHRLPFESDAFDLVQLWSVLHWVGRNEYLQALGEAVRVTRKYLVVMDFVAEKGYRVPYHHDTRFFTYKSDFEAPIACCGTMEKLYERRWWTQPGTVEFRYITEADLHPFLANPKSYYARKMVVFRKNPDVLPTLERSDFE
jgi:ubiquinone/menaquinone biosynthesis C-methylase UbiE